MPSAIDVVKTLTKKSSAPDTDSAGLSGLIDSLISLMVVFLKLPMSLVELHIRILNHVPLLDGIPHVLKGAGVVLPMLNVFDDLSKKLSTVDWLIIFFVDMTAFIVILGIISPFLTLGAACFSKDAATVSLFDCLAIFGDIF